VTSCSSGEGWAEAAEGAHCQSGDRLGVVEAEATADDQAALHRIVLVRMRWDPRTIVYVQRRTTEGRTKRVRLWAP
jgi:hypothetical protein